MNYDQAAAQYAAHRRIHPGVFQELCQQGWLTAMSRVVEVGCGTGNYAKTLVSHFGCTAYGLDPSAAMLARARDRRENVVWLLGRAEELPLLDGSLDLVFSVDTIHHVGDKAAFYREAARVLRPGGRVCTVTDSEDMIRRREILSGYFPETVDLELARYPRLAQVEEWMAKANLEAFGLVTVEERYELSSAQPFRDRAYSVLHLIPERAWRSGLERLERDLAQGAIPGASRYACLWGRKG